MIVNFSIQNFGCIKDKQTLSFEADNSNHLEDYYTIHTIGGLRLLKLGLIYGANASGKTTILKALEFLRDIVLNPEDKKTESLNFKPFLFDNVSLKLNSILSIEFIQNETRYFYEVELNQRAIVKETLNHYNPTKANVFKRSTDLEKQFTRISFGSKIKKDKTFEKTLESNTLWNNTVLGGFLKTNIESKELKDTIDWFSNYLNRLIYTGTQLDNYVTKRLENSEISKFDIINILKKADFNISDLIIKDDDKIPEKMVKLLTALDLPKEKIGKIVNTPLKKIEFEHTVNNVKYSLPINLESQGTQRYYGFSGLLSLLIKNSIAIPIDELEASLHPDLFIHFLLSFLVNSKNSQIIATTHNREVLNNKDIFRNDAIWFTDKTENCATELYSLSDFDSSVIRDTSNVYNAYKIGKLGGVPNLGDYYIEINDEKK
ncbi:AAA family ATPase [Flavobacterium branchiophilum]|uniref:ATP-binding protein n=1 Tax=Flavobacterium branchiophilum TaxID=55197 RepID=A0A2H3K8Y5_9FLAO|nr:ATP-binding protein [Flavobacterium branchiophilum]PDS22298.1 ATP-binding protein [Flavobacterium branchiophilum]